MVDFDVFVVEFFLVGIAVKGTFIEGIGGSVTPVDDFSGATVRLFADCEGGADARAGEIDGILFTVGLAGAKDAGLYVVRENIFLIPCDGEKVFAAEFAIVGAVVTCLSLIGIFVD